MKKITLYVLLLIAILLSPWIVYSGTLDDGTITGQSVLRTDMDNIYILQVVYKAGAAGEFTATTLDLPINGYIMLAETIPSPFTDTTLSAIATAKSWTEYSPTTNYDLTITNTGDMDLFGTNLQNRSAINVEYARPLLSGTAGAIEAYSRVTLNMSGNSVANSVQAIRLWLFRR